MNELLIEAVGWIATAVFTMSFLFADVTRLRAVQICGALLWIGYGLLIGSLPVVVANVLVFVVASWTTARYVARRSIEAAN
jgi:hypothetical protein